MRIWVLLPITALLFAGCSKPAEESKSEQLGKEMAEKMKAPIEDTRTLTEKIQKTREVELPK